MRVAGERAAVVLMEAFMYRIHPQIAWALAQVAAGRIGAVTARPRWLWLRHRRPPERHPAEWRRSAAARCWMWAATH